MFEQFKISKGTKVAMVGYFRPLIKHFEQREAVLDILDQSRGLGRKADFYKNLKKRADVLFMYGVEGSVLASSQKLTELKVPVVFCGDYLEAHPPGQSGVGPVFCQLLQERKAG